MGGLAQIMLTAILSVCENESEQEFIEKIYSQYKYIMLKTARQYESDPDIVDDLIQDSLVKLIKKTSLLMSLERCSLVSYIVYTVKNTAINHLRHRSVIRQHISEQESQEDAYRVDDKARSVEDLLISSIQAEELRSVLARLPERDQILLQGKYQLYLSDEELAKTLNCKPDSVRMMLTRARRHALDLLEKEGFVYGNQ